MEKGILTYARDFLVGNWKATDNVAMGVVPMGRMSMSGEALKPGNIESHTKANKGTVYACTDLIGLGVGDTPLRVYITKTGREKSNFKKTITRQVSKERKDEIFRKAVPGTELSRAADLEEVLNGPLVDLLRQVNGYMNAFDSKKLTSANMDLTGNAYWILVRNSFGRPASIWFAPSAYMSVIPDKETWIKGYKYKKGTTEIEYPAEDVVQFKCVSIASQYYGVAPLLACADAYNLENYMLNFEAQMFKTGGNPKVIIWTKNPMTEKEAKRIKESFSHIKDGDAAVMAGSDFQIEQMTSPTSRDMGFQHGLGFARDTIAMVMHVPKSMLTADDVNRATALAQQYHLAKYAISPRCTQIDEKISEQLAPQFDTRYVTLFDNPVPDDIEQEREDRKVNMENAITTINEERARLGLEPIEGGDEILVPVNRVPISEAGSQEEAESAERVAAMALEKVGYPFRWRYPDKGKYPLKKEWHHESDNEEAGR